MPIGLYIVPYTRTENTPPQWIAIQNEKGETIGYDFIGEMARRTCDIYLQFPEIQGQLEREVRGNRAFVKIKADEGLLEQLNALYYRLPVDDLESPLSEVKQMELDGLMGELMDMGYSPEEFAQALPRGLEGATMGEVVKFMASSVILPRFDPDTNEIVFDGMKHVQDEQGVIRLVWHGPVSKESDIDDLDRKVK